MKTTGTPLKAATLYKALMSSSRLLVLYCFVMVGWKV